jgi:class 3 adenylate cyclase
MMTSPSASFRRWTLPRFHSIALHLRAFYDRLHKSGKLPVAREQRKLAAILAADVVGYSRLMGRDENWPSVSALTQRAAGYALP